MKNYNIIARIASDIIMIALLAWAPVYAVAIFAIAFAWFFSPYYEIIAWGIAYDSLYGLHSIYGTIAALAIFVIVEVLKKKTRM